MASAGGDGPALPPPPPVPPAGMTRLCPACGVRRPVHHFMKRNARSIRNLVVYCATCRGFQPVDPRRVDGIPGGGGAIDAVENGHEDDDEDDDDDDYIDDDDDSGSSDSDHSHASDDDRRRHLGGFQSNRHRHHRRHRHAGGDDTSEAQLRDESEWVLTGLGIVLYFFGWFSIVALFVVIVSF